MDTSNDYGGFRTALKPCTLHVDNTRPEDSVLQCFLKLPNTVQSSSVFYKTSRLLLELKMSVIFKV